MHKQREKVWFPAKRYGFGWGVANTWQGAIIQIGYVALLAFGSPYLLRRREIALFWTLFIVITALFVFVHWLKGERAGWRWGGS